MAVWEVTVAFLHSDGGVSYDHDEYVNAETSEEAMRIVKEGLTRPELIVMWTKVYK